MLLLADRDPGEGPFHQECGDLLAVHFREHREEIRPPRVADPHLGAVQQIVGPVGGERCLGAHGQRVGARGGLAQAVGGHPLSRGELCEVFGLLGCGAKIGKRLGANSAVSPACDTKSAVAGELLGDPDRGHLPEPQPAVILRHLDGQQSELTGLAEELHRHPRLLML